MRPGHKRQRLTMVSHLPTNFFPDTRASSHTVVVPETATAIGSCCRWGLPPLCSSHSRAIAIHVDYACDTTNSTSPTSPDGGHPGVPATRYFEDIQAGGVLGNSKAALVGRLAARRLPVLFH